jgi:hypothetical protein
VPGEGDENMKKSKGFSVGAERDFPHSIPHLFFLFHRHNKQELNRRGGGGQKGFVSRPGYCRLILLMATCGGVISSHPSPSSSTPFYSSIQSSV